MKNNSIQAITIVIINILVGLLFFQYSGINYNPGGVRGEASTLNLVLSIIYILIIFGVAFAAGLFNLRGVIRGLFGFFIVVIVLFFIGGLGIGSIIAIFVLPTFIYFAPFAPVIDTLSHLTNPSYVNDKAIIYIPFFCYLVSLLIYYLGCKIRLTKTHTHVHMKRI
jgi:hypothetical protein